MHPPPYSALDLFSMVGKPLITSLAGWYRDGADVPGRLPWLSTVMGHSGPASTYWYVSASPELMALAAQRLQAHVDQGGGASRAGQS
jgi:hypothetical protein